MFSFLRKKRKGNCIVCKGAGEVKSNRYLGKEYKKHFPGYEKCNICNGTGNYYEPDSRDWCKLEND